MTTRHELFRTLDDRLSAAGFPRRTPWWEGQFARFYGNLSIRRFIGRIGRGGAKSTYSARFALTEVLSGGFDVAPGEQHYFAFVSENVTEALQRIRLLGAYLRALGLPHAVLNGDTIEIEGMSVGFKVFASRVGAVSGFRCVGFVCDEEAKWRAADSSANPAEEVVASLRAMCVTHPDAREWHISSPLGTVDYHAEQFDRGDSEHQITASAPTWVANPSINEQQTRRLEPNERIWKREYLAIPQANALGAFDLDAIESAFAPRGHALAMARPVIVCDPSSGRKDSWTWAVASWCYPPDASEVLYTDGKGNLSARHSVEFQIVARDKDGNALRNPNFVRDTLPYLAFHEIDGEEGRFWERTSVDKIVRKVAAVARRWDTVHVHSDQRESYALEGLFNAEGLRFFPHDWTATSKPMAIERLRRLFADKQIAFPPHDKLKRELLTFEEKITPSGGFTFSARGSGHDDYVSLAVTACLADIAGALSMSPVRQQSTMIEMPINQSGNGVIRLATR